jgi:hypothetical protein
MKFKIEKKAGSKKDVVKLDRQKSEQYSNVVRHADYQARQEIIQAPFGKTFKTGGHIDKKREVGRGAVKHKGKGWD